MRATRGGESGRGLRLKPCYVVVAESYHPLADQMWEGIGLLICLLLFLAIRRAGDQDDVSMVGHPVESGRSQERIVKDCPYPD